MRMNKSESEKSQLSLSKARLTLKKSILRDQSHVISYSKLCNMSFHFITRENNKQIELTSLKSRSSLNQKNISQAMLTTKFISKNCWPSCRYTATQNTVQLRNNRLKWMIQLWQICAGRNFHNRGRYNTLLRKNKFKVSSQILKLYLQKALLAI